jgi:hypothetical protein
VHAYLITAKPSRRQQALRWLGRWIPRALVWSGLLLLGLAVFGLRAARALIGLAATFAARIEFEAATRAGKPPVGQTIGVGVADAFTAEFNRGWASRPAA